MLSRRRILCSLPLSGFSYICDLRAVRLDCLARPAFVLLSTISSLLVDQFSPELLLCARLFDPLLCVCLVDVVFCALGRYRDFPSFLRLPAFSAVSFALFGSISRFVE